LLHSAINGIKSYLRGHLSPSQRRAVRRVVNRVRTVGRTSNLSFLATVYGTDKWGVHFYTQHYQRYFEKWRRKPIKILEIGVGGYSDLAHGAASLRMWKRYFPHASIIGIDLYDKSALSENRVQVLQCDQTDSKKLTEISLRYGPFDIVIDDGSHLNEHVVQTFQILFPLLNTPGYYAIEDLQTAYWPSWGGIKGKSSIDYLKTLIDGLNYVENPVKKEATYYDTHITEIALFHNLCIIRKDVNNEQSNVPELVDKERSDSDSVV
jgi:cephalosporin hydroxylase